MTKEEAIKQYYSIYLKDISKAREIIKSMNYKNDHQLLEMIALSYIDEAMFNDYGEAKENIDSRKRAYAERYALRAFELNPTCSNVLWTLAKIKKSCGQYSIAINCYRAIIQLGAKRISRDSCRNKNAVILAQINDSKFELYRLLNKSNPSLSKRYLTLYKKGLQKGISTLYKPYTKYLLPTSIFR